MENPYAAPEAELKEFDSGERPRSPKIIGSISMLIGVVSVLMMIVTLIALSSGLAEVVSEMKAAGLDGSLMYISVGLGLISSIWLLFIGFKLFRYWDIGRRHFKIYMIFQAISSALTMGYQYFKLPDYSDATEILLPGVISTLLILLIMIWLLRILNKPEVRASLT